MLYYIILFYIIIIYYIISVYEMKWYCILFSTIYIINVSYY